MFENIHDVQELAEAASAAEDTCKTREERWPIRTAFFKQMSRICFQRPGPDQKRLDVLANYAWREHHSEGYGQVADCYQELAYLLEPKA